MSGPESLIVTQGGTNGPAIETLAHVCTVCNRKFELTPQDFCVTMDLMEFLRLKMKNQEVCYDALV
jgi:hypothetical protein